VSLLLACVSAFVPTILSIKLPIHPSVDQCACLPACVCVCAMPCLHPSRSIHPSVDSFLQLAGHTSIDLSVCYGFIGKTPVCCSSCVFAAIPRTLLPLSTSCQSYRSVPVCPYELGTGSPPPLTHWHPLTSPSTHTQPRCQLSCAVCCAVLCCPACACLGAPVCRLLCRACVSVCS